MSNIQESKKQSKKKRLEENEKDLNSSDLQKDADSSDLKRSNKEIDDFQLGFINQLPLEDKAKVVTKQLEKLKFRADTHKEIDKLDIDSPSTELKEIEMEGSVVKNDIEATRYVSNILDNSNVSMSDADRTMHSNLYSAQSSCIAKYIVAVGEHKANIKKRLEILASADDSDDDDNDGDNNGGSNNPGSGGAGDDGSNNPGTSGGAGNSGDASNNSRSLIDDFADLSTEMPSYMDPED